MFLEAKLPPRTVVVTDEDGIRYVVPNPQGPWKVDKHEWDYASPSDEARAAVRQLAVLDRALDDHKDDARWLIGEGDWTRATVATRSACRASAERKRLTLRLEALAPKRAA